DLARIAGEEMHPARKLALEIIDALDRVAVGENVDAVILQPRTGRERQQGRVPGVDADLEHPLLEPRRAPDVAPRRRKRRRRRAGGEALAEVGIEDVAFEAFAGPGDDGVEAGKSAEKDGRQDLVER